MKTTLLALAVLALFSAFAAYMAREAQAGDATAMDEMSIDMVVAGNSATVLGTTQSCQRINENNSMDADETAIDTLTFDVTATNIPSSNPMIAFSYDINYNSSALTVVQSNTVFLLAANSGSSLFTTSDTEPDNNINNSHSVGALDTSTSAPEFGSGVLARQTISSDTGAAAAQYPITLSNNVHIDDEANPHFPNVTNDATIAVGQPCGGGATPTPSPTPTAAPTATPTTAPTASPTASPTTAPTASPTTAPTASPTASPTAAPTASPPSTPGGPTETPGGPTPTPTQTPGPTDTPGPTGTGAPTPTPTTTPVPTPLPSGVTPQPTVTPTPAPSGSPTATDTPGPSQTPDPSGTPSTSETPGPSGTPGSGKKGSVDCDADVDSIDALHVLRFVGGLGQTQCIDQADVDCDSDSDTVDALKILRHVAALPVDLPNGCMPIGSATS